MAKVCYFQIEKYYKHKPDIGRIIIKLEVIKNEKQGKENVYGPCPHCGNAIVVVEDFNLDAPKTKDFVNIAKNLKVDSKKVLLVLPEVEKNVYLSARNLQKAEVMTAAQVNSYKVLNADVVVITENSLKVIDEILTK